MGYPGKLSKKILAQKLRAEGLSYKEILQKVPVSKDTISRWCREISLSGEQKEKLLNNKIAGQKRGSLIAAENKKKKKNILMHAIYKEALSELGKVSDREKFLLGIALYAAEGTKMDKHGAFSNADPALILFMTNWFINYAKVPKERLRGRIWLHSNLDENVAKAFWSKLTMIPMSQFIKTYTVAKKANSLRKNIHNYGVFTISFSDAHAHRKIMGWISGLFGDKISSIFRDSSTVEQEAVLAAF